MNTKTRFKPIKRVFQRNINRVWDVTVILTHDRRGYLVKVKSPTLTAEMGADEGYGTLEEAEAGFEKRCDYYSAVAAEAGFPVEYERKKTGRKIPCNGEAHSNPFIDHCMVCLGGTWGELDELASIDFDRAKRARLDVPGPGLSDEELRIMREKVASGEATFASTHRGNAWYSVFRWTGK